MKQETINLIKSMTKQGFLVIVDPETYNGNETPVVISEKQKEELNPEPSVIFTNCVGEVFTEEDKETNMEVWWAENDTLTSAGIRYISHEDFATHEDYTDIFRSKKSLLKYLYETCD